jgi:hypothetical protein
MQICHVPFFNKKNLQTIKQKNNQKRGGGFIGNALFIVLGENFDKSRKV